jgi:two-component system, chemotaxis family, sensor kinase CheA
MPDQLGRSMDEFICDFVADTQDGFDQIRPDLSLWEADATNSEALDAIFRFVHTVNGNAAFLKFERFERLCKPVENALYELRSGSGDASPQRIRSIAKLIRRMHDIASAIEAGVGLSAADEADMVRAIGYEPLPPSHAFPIAKRAQSRAGTIRLSVEQFETLMTSIEELASAHRSLLDTVAHMAMPSILNPALFKLSSAIATTGDAIASSRKQPLGALFSGLDRLAIQTAEKTGKSVLMTTEGQDILVDRELIDSLRDCFIHIVRNAVDHGIESPEARLRSGKDVCGRVAISASQSPTGLRLTLSDDGRGVDPAQILGAAPGQSNDSIAAILSRPGFSTAQGSEISGRGVGLDVVKTQIEKWGGTMSIDPNPGVGMAISLFIPTAAEIKNVA